MADRTLTLAASSHTAITGGYTNPTYAYVDGDSSATAAPAKSAELSAYWGFAQITAAEIGPDSNIVSVLMGHKWSVSSDTSIATEYWQVFLDTVGQGAEQSNAAEPTTETTSTHTISGTITWTDLNTADRMRLRTRSARGNSNQAVTFNLQYVYMTVTYQAEVNAAVQTYTLTAGTVGFGRTYVMPAEVRTYALTGQNTNGLRTYIQPPPATEQYTLTGIDVNLNRGKNFPIEVTTFDLTGQDVGLKATRFVGAEAGAYTLSLLDSGTLATRTTSAGAGAYTLTGVDVALTSTTVVVPVTAPAGGGNWWWRQQAEERKIREEDDEAALLFLLGSYYEVSEL